MKTIIGDQAEALALAVEKNELSALLQNRVRLVATEHRGYDIESVEEIDGILRLKVIEVKAWNKEGYFYITEFERQVLTSMGDQGWIYLVDTASEKVVKKIKNPFASPIINLKPAQYKYFY